MTSNYINTRDNVERWGTVRRNFPDEEPQDLWYIGGFISGDKETKDYLVTRYNIRAYRRNKHNKQLMKRILKDENMEFVRRAGSRIAIFTLKGVR